MIMHKEFTTGQVARLCSVSPKTVCHWVDSGLLPGFRERGSLERRISLVPLVRFMRKHGFPLGELAFDGAIRVFVVSSDEWGEALHLFLPSFDGFSVEVFRNAFTAGLSVLPSIPEVVILDLRLPGVSRIRMDPALQDSLFFAVSPKLDPEVFALGFHDAFPLPVDLALLSERILAFLSKDQLRQSWLK